MDITSRWCDGKSIGRTVNALLREGFLSKAALMWLFPEERSSLDLLAVENFQPVSNLPFGGRVVKWVMISPLQGIWEQTDDLDPFQSNFRLGYVTESDVVTLTDDLL